MIAAFDWLGLDETLGLAEAILIPVSLAYLLVATVRGGRSRRIRALVLAPSSR